MSGIVHLMHLLGEISSLIHARDTPPLYLQLIFILCKMIAVKCLEEKVWKLQMTTGSTCHTQWPLTCHFLVPLGCRENIEGSKCPPVMMKTRSFLKVINFLGSFFATTFIIPLLITAGVAHLVKTAWPNNYLYSSYSKTSHKRPPKLCSSMLSPKVLDIHRVV